jgi:HEAT repeats
MEAGAHRNHADPNAGITPEQEAVAQAAEAWVQQFARTLKNCRTYEFRSPTVLRFRQQLAASLMPILAQHGSLTLRFTSDDVTCEGVSLYPAKSRDDNFALPFYRDGVRAITFLPGLLGREVDAVLLALVQVTGPSAGGEDDLVTLLWQSGLEHVDVDFVPAEGEVTPGADAEAEGELVMWPTGATESDPVPAPDAQTETQAEPQLMSAPESDRAARGAADGRSDDWAVGEATADFEAGFDALESVSELEVQRFHREHASEREVPLVAMAMAIARAYLAAESLPDDLPELQRFVPRLLRLSLMEGRWAEAADALSLLADYGGDEWSPDTLAQELQQPIAIAELKSHLEVQDAENTAEFIRFANALGGSSVDVLCHVMAELEAPRHPRLFVDAITESAREAPERLAPWLADSRPLVVRTIVQILGAIGGNDIAGLLGPALRHPDARVRADAVQAMRTVDTAAARPLLLSVIAEGTDSRLFCAALQQAAETRDPDVARMAIELMLGDDFEVRPPEEKRAIYGAIGSAGGDEILPELEAELVKGGWFARANDNHQLSVARAIARIGTPMARMVLEHGAQSRRAPVRAACEEILARWKEHRG